MDFVLNIFTVYWHFMVLYLAGGVVYSALKWTLSLIKLRRLINAYTGLDKKTFATTRSNEMFGNFEYPPLARNNIGKFTLWALFWPINLVWTALADVAVEFFSWIWERLGAVMQAIAHAILPQVEDKK